MIDGQQPDINFSLFTENDVPSTEQETFAPASPEVKAALAKFREDFRKRSFSGRHPELGKMVNCKVCGTRHRQHERTCVQKFVELHKEIEIDDDGNETGELTTVYKTALRPDLGKKPTIRQTVGAAQFKGKRKRPHLSRTKLMFVERVRALLGPDYDPSQLDPRVRQEMLNARKLAGREIRKEERMARKKARKRQDIHRRVRNGLIPGNHRHQNYPQG
jgi:hypothetical protein